MDRAPSARVGVDPPAIGSTTAVLPIVAAHNPGLSRLFHLAASAANQQQNLAHRLLSQPDPEPPSRQDNAAAAIVTFLRELARRPAESVLSGRPCRSLAPCSPCFIWSRSGIRNSFNRNLAPAHGLECIMRLW